MLETGEVIGETLRLLELYGQLTAGKLNYRIPFPVAMDQLHQTGTTTTQQSIDEYIERNLPTFEQQTTTQQQVIRQQVERYLSSYQYQAMTFERFQLKGTPSHIVVDKKGRIRACEFGQFDDLETLIQQLLQE